MQFRTKLLTAATCAAFAIPSMAFAQFTSGDELKAEDLIPSSIDIKITIDTGAEHPFTEFLDELVPTLGGESFNAEEFLANNQLTFALEMTEHNAEDPYALPNMFAIANISDENFESLAVNEYSIPHEYNGLTIYEIDDDFFALQLNNLVVIASTKELAESIADTYADGGDTLAKNSVWINGQKRLTQEGFFELYMNPLFVAEGLSSNEDPFTTNSLFQAMGLKNSLIERLVGEMFSIKQTDEGFIFDIYVEGDTQKLAELDMFFNKYNFTPSMYNLVNGENIVFYMENGATYDAIIDSLNVYEESSEVMMMYNEAMAEMKAETGLDFEQEVLPYLNGKHMIAMHHNHQSIPALTAIFEVDPLNRPKVAAALTLLNNKLKEENADNPDYKASTKTAANTTFYVHEDEDMTLWMATTTDNLLVISTHENLANIFRVSGGMKNNASFSNQLSLDSMTSGLVFMDFHNLYQYVRYMTEMDGAGESELAEMDEFADIWHDLYLQTYSTQNQAWGSLNLRMDWDLEAIGALSEFLNKSNYIDDAYIEQPFPPEGLNNPDDKSAESFCDVKTDDWYYHYVTDLSKMKVVQGYAQGCFRPNNPVTRAEFVKMFIAGLEAIDYPLAEIPTNTPAYFSDVNDEWFTEYVNKAASNLLIEGYTDDTFRPINPITRAEAVQTLWGLTMMNEFPMDHPFNDVLATDWFNDSVSSMYDAGIISGRTTTTFDPHAQITRAEAAKIIKLYLDYLES